jgi:hypothetical protein
MGVAGVAVTVACGAGAGKSSVRVAPTPNSEAGRTGPQVLADASRAFATVPEVRMTGTQVLPGSTKTSKADLRIQADGGIGSIQFSGGAVQMIMIKQRLYLKGDLSFLEPQLVTKSAAAGVAGRWGYMVDDSGEPDGLKGLAQQLTALGDGVKVEPAVTTETLDGQRVVVVRESDGSRMYVSAKGAPLPLKITSTGSGGNGLASMGNVAFTYGGDPVQLRAPAGAVLIPDPTYSYGSNPSGWPTDFPTHLPTALPSGFPTEFFSDFPSGFPTALASQLRSLAAAHGAGPAATASPSPTP